MYKKLATAAVLAACMGVAHADLPSAISLGDAYCDYLENLTPMASGGYSGTWSNISCTGMSVQIGGAATPAYSSQAAGAVMGSQGLALSSMGGREATYWITEDMTWRLYNYKGVVVGKGKWTPRTNLTVGQKALLGN